jgi:hypothetical protein
MTQPDASRLPSGSRLSDNARRQALEQFVNPQAPIANVVGFGHGVKWTDHAPTGEPALLVFVTQKMPSIFLDAEDLLPSRTDDGTVIDVVSVGQVMAQPLPMTQMEEAVTDLLDDAARGRQRAAVDLLEEAATRGRQLGAVQPSTTGPEALTKRMRPCPSGFSIGNVAITAGTLGSVVYDFLPGASIDPPHGGIGIPRNFYVLSNNHVLAASNTAPLGSAIVQPGKFDGGADPQDRIATLSRFVPIQFAPDVPLNRHNNVVDCAIGACQFQAATRDIYFSGPPRGWRRKANVEVGDRVRKTGRTTNTTFGRIISTNATVDVGYGSAGTARFHDQIITTNISAGGDSGSLVTTYDNVAVGLLFAGSSVATVINHFETVRAMLRIEVAEQLM